MKRTRDEMRHELAVHRVGERLIVIELVGAGANCALLCFLNDKWCHCARKPSHVPVRHCGAERIRLWWSNSIQWEGRLLESA